MGVHAPLSVQRKAQAVTTLLPMPYYDNCVDPEDWSQASLEGRDDIQVCRSLANQDVSRVESPRGQMKTDGALLLTTLARAWLMADG